MKKGYNSLRKIKAYFKIVAVESEVVFFLVVCGLVVEWCVLV